MYEVTTDELLEENIKTFQCSSFKEAMAKGRKLQQAETNRVFVGYVRKNGERSDLQWIIYPEGQVEYA